MTKGSKSSGPAGPGPNKTTTPSSQIIPDLELPEKMKVTDKEQENQPKEEEEDDEDEEQVIVSIGYRYQDHY